MSTDMKSKRKTVLIVVIFAAISALTILIVQNIPLWQELFAKKELIVFKRNANSSAGIFYKYELDRDDILRETDHYSARHFLNCGPGYAEVWEFEIIGDGEVTITWTGYEGGRESEEISFYETYLINDKEHTKIFDSRSAA